MDHLPRHIAIVMDGNGRWAKKRGLPRILGHRAGSEAIKKVVKACITKKIEVLTLWAFSTENWNRPETEVNYLMKLLFDNLHKGLEDLNKNDVKLRIIGDIESLKTKLQQEIHFAEEATAKNSGLKLNIAFNYGGRWDILSATRKVAEQVAQGKLKTNDITLESISKYICLSDLPEPDLFIRTSGELRLSNFMLWQLAYAEFYFTSIYWPDFDEEALDEALADFARRDRRFGGITC